MNSTQSLIHPIRIIFIALYYIYYTIQSSPVVLELTLGSTFFARIYISCSLVFTADSPVQREKPSRVDTQREISRKTRMYSGVSNAQYKHRIRSFTIINVHGLQRQMIASNRITLMKQPVYFVSHMSLRICLILSQRIRGRARINP